MERFVAAAATSEAAQTVPVDEFQQFLEGLRATEVRLAVSGAVVIVTVVLAAVFAPRVVAWVSRSVERALPESALVEYLDRTMAYVPARLTVLLVRGIQLALLLGAVLSLLVVWGLVDVAIAILGYVGQSIPLLVDVLVTFVVVLLTYVGIDVLDDAVARYSERADRVTDHQEEIIRRLGRLGIIVLAGATVLTLWGQDLSGLLVGAGFLGIVVGLAARQTLGSLIAGFVLMFSRPFTIGDWVEIGDEEGIVTDITIVNTRLENFDGEFVVIPNDRVANEAITNRSRKGHLRLRLDVGVDYDSDPDHASEVALDAMDDVDAIEPTPPPQAVLKEFGNSAVIVELRFWIDRPTPPRKWQATNAVVEAIKEAFDREGIKIPFPQRELSGRAETGGFRVNSAVPAPGRDGVDDADPSRRSEPGGPRGTDGRSPTQGAVESADESTGSTAGAGDGEQPEPETDTAPESDTDD